MINVLAQGHNAVTPVRLKPAAPQSRDKHSTSEPLRSLLSTVLNPTENRIQGLFMVFEGFF